MELGVERQTAQGFGAESVEGVMESAFLFPCGTDVPSFGGLGLVNSRSWTHAFQQEQKQQSCMPDQL